MNLALTITFPYRMNDNPDAIPELFGEGVILKLQTWNIL